MESQLVNHPLPDSPAETIPRIIHQTWKTRDLPSRLSACTASVANFNPKWDYRFYTDDDIVDIVAATGEFKKDAFLKIPSAIERSDVFKAAVLYLEGGIYCDIDIEAFQPFETILGQLPEQCGNRAFPELWMTPDHPIHCARLFGYPAIKNHFMISRPGATFLSHYLSAVAEKSKTRQLGGDPVHSTGTAFLTQLMRSRGDHHALKVGTLPSKWVNPLPDLTLNFPEILLYRNLISSRQWIQRLKPHAVHYWWHGYSRRSNMIDDFGEELFYNRVS